MSTEHFFKRWQGGVASVAKVTVELHPNSTWDVTWNNPSATRSIDFYGASVEEGVRLAADEHEQRGGAPQLVEIVELVDWPADTRADAVRCAAALATWKALGHTEAEANVTFEDGEWRVSFQNC